MLEQIATLSAEQDAFVSALPEMKENQVISGFDRFAASQYCTPSFFGCKICIGATASNGVIALSIQASTPLGTFDKTFKVSGNVNFGWNPIFMFKVNIKITNFRKSGNFIKFDASVKGCVKVPVFDDKCASFSHSFAIPAVSLPAQKALSNGSKAETENSERDYNTLLLFHALMDEKNGCNCH